MQLPSQLNDIIQNLFEDYYGETASSISPLPGAGSARQYYRVRSGHNKAIATFNSVIAENEACFHLNQQFLKCGLNVPEIFAIHKNRKVYLQTDLGDLHLFDLVQQANQSGGFNKQVYELYEKVLTQLVQFQVEAHKRLDYNYAWPSRKFDKQAAIDDLNYFKYYFLKLHLIECNESALGNDFELLAGFIAEAPNDFFMYRDFQSRNIMIHNNEPYFIDYQGGKQGPLQYDLVSLLYQAKAQIPHKSRTSLKDFYLDQLSAFVDPKHIKFDKYHASFIYLRLLQVLGAYGFRGLIQGKKHFVESIPFAINQVEDLINNNPLPLKLPQLELVLKQLIPLRNLYQNPEPDNDHALTIYVNSFSYLKGRPPHDKSGNGGGYVFDCRALPNPGRIDQFKMLSGNDTEVIEFFEKEPEMGKYLESAFQLICNSVDNYLARGFKSLLVSFGCTGGQHRSVYCAEKTAQFLKNKYGGLIVDLKHLQLQNEA
jgi:aminoglycoside/choline kinase family phosphotransferase